jgi:hypothetical protein
MKRCILSIMVLTMICSQTLIASSTIEGGEKHKHKDMGGPSTQADLGEKPLDSQMEMQAATAIHSEVESAAQDAAATTVTNVIHDRDVAPQAGKKFEAPAKKVKPMKMLREAKQQNGGGSVIGILALVFGILGFLLAFLLWPVGLLFGITAIVLGAVGIGTDRGQVMSIVGLVLGILTLLIPVLVVALLLAVFL